MIFEWIRVLGVRYPALSTNAKLRIGLDHSLNASVETYAYISAIAADQTFGDMMHVQWANPICCHIPMYM